MKKQTLYDEVAAAIAPKNNANGIARLNRVADAKVKSIVLALPNVTLIADHSGEFGPFWLYCSAWRGKSRRWFKVSRDPSPYDGGKAIYEVNSASSPNHDIFR